MESVKIFLNEGEMPTHWYNIQADLPKPLPPVIHPGTGEPIGPEDLAPLFPMALIAQASGRKDRDDANVVFNQSATLAGVCALVTLVGGYGLTGGYMATLGADEATTLVESMPLPSKPEVSLAPEGGAPGRTCARAAAVRPARDACPVPGAGGGRPAAADGIVSFHQA